MKHESTWRRRLESRTIRPVYVPVGIGGLANAGVAHLLLNPSNVGPGLEQPGRIGMAQSMRLAVGQFRLGEERLPDVLQEVGVAADASPRVREDELTLAAIAPRGGGRGIGSVHGCPDRRLRALWIVRRSSAGG